MPNCAQILAADSGITGASSTVVKMPRGAGRTSARIEAGAASVVVLVPDGVAARIQASMGLGSTDIDQRRFPFANGEYTSPDYATAPNQLSLRIEGGVGSLTVK